MSEIAYFDAQAAVIREPCGKFVMEPVGVRHPAQDEILIQIVACGLCHADIIARDQVFPVPLPVVLGHEGAGIVSAVGPLVTDFGVGDHVVLSFGFCGRCRWCEADEPAYCVEFLTRNFACAETVPEPAMIDAHHDRLHSQFFTQSSLGTYALARSSNAVKVGKDVSLELLGPLGCGVQTGAGAVFNTLNVTPGATIAIFGMGAVGLSALLAAKAAGAGTVIAVDVIESRMTLAMELGATHALRGDDPSLSAEIRTLTDGGADYAVEASGHPQALRQAINGVGIRGTVAVLGAPPPGTCVEFDVHDLLQSGKTIRGVVEGDSRPKEFIPKLIDLFKQGRFPFDKIVRFYEFADLNQAVADSEMGVAIKAIVKMAR